ncbi:hypothetical protein [Acuticoccus sediminis]|uniref:hypothetical protein n=1 Tax=Acuticoccus sediminis TaxID=2184697 RepID=UPI0011B939F6|nr:hypothetical protein [Acuticoccus sediminis]
MLRTNDQHCTRAHGRAAANASVPLLYAPEAGFDPATVALRFSRQARRESAAKALGWSLADYRDVTAQSLAIADEEADVAGHA